MNRGLLIATAMIAAGLIGIAIPPQPVPSAARLNSPNAASPADYREPTPIATAGLPVQLEALTWTEVRALIRAGTTTVIVPTGGTEQNGPHMVLGKHNYIVRHAAERIARRLGNTLVAPVLTYVPEGSIEPPDGHMAYAGTISIAENTFASILDATARSLRAHGFTTIAFVGDSGGNQAAQQRVAQALSAQWIGNGARVLHVSDYYADNQQMTQLLAAGETEVGIGSHAGIRDTSELMAVYPDGVRLDRRRPDTDPGMAWSGVIGDPTRASGERGETLLRLKVEAAVRQIRRETAASPGQEKL